MSNEARPITDVLREIRGGDMSEELSQALRELIPIVIDEGKKGTITLKLEVIPYKGDTTSLRIKDDIKVTSPETAPLTLFFIDRQNNLVRKDPNQPSLPGLEAVDDGTTMQIDEETGEVLSAGDANHPRG